MRKIKIGYDDHLKKDVYKLKYDNIPEKKVFSSSDVIFGNPNSNVAIGFIYTWQEDKAPKKVHDFFVKLSNYAAVTGYWKTTNGAKYVFANILSNPNINKLVLLVFDQKDNGHLLVEALTKFWDKGIDKNGIIIGSKAPNPKFEGLKKEELERVKKQADLLVVRKIKEEDFDHIEKIVHKQVEWPEGAVSAKKFKGLEFYSNYRKDDLLYDDGARFDKPMIVDFSSASETVEYDSRKTRLNQSIAAEDLDEGIKQAAAFIFNNGDMMRDMRGTLMVEFRSFSLTVRDALAKIPSSFSKEYIKKYVDEFMKGKGELDEFAYTYHDRIFRKWGNQVERAIEVLKRDKNSRRIMISLWDPAKDLESKNSPCLDFIWASLRNDMLEFHIVYRSHHIATVDKKGKLIKGEGALVPNLYALATLQEYIAKKLKVKRGSLYLTDFSGHLYVAEE